MYLKTVVFIGVLVSSFFSLKGQQIYFQDSFKGEVFVRAVSSQSSTIINHTPSIGSVLKKAFLISGNQNDNVFTQNDYPTVVEINGVNFTLNKQNQKTLRFPAIHLQNSGAVHVLAISPEILLNTISINVVTPNFPVGENENYRYHGMTLVLLYENMTLPQLDFIFWLNNKRSEYEINHSYNGMNPINTTYPAGLALSYGHVMSVSDGSYVWVNSDSLGLVSGPYEWNTINTGTLLGQFNYSSNTINAIGDDNSDTQMNEADVLSNISPILATGVTSFTLKSIYFNPLLNEYATSSNPIWATFLAYTSNCGLFEVTAPNDTTVCEGSSLQLNAEGGTSFGANSGYLWQPATGLSCTNCPNPVFTADSSMFYTVRIFNNDSCSVVRPVKINVRPRPNFGEISLTPSECGASTGSANLFAVNGNTSVANWQEVGGASQTSNVFQNLSAGSHTFNFIDTSGCQSADTTIVIGEINSTVVSFMANPQSGAVPLEVNFTNTSSNAINFEWSVSDSSTLLFQGANLPNWEFANSGYYEVMLVAWQFDPSCADTFTLNIFIYDSLIVTIPNVFTPNNDGVNDFFGISSSLVVDAEVIIFNRWGNEVFSRSVTLQPGFNKIWDSSNVIDGTYFYRVVLAQNLDVPKVKGLETALEKTGFVEVRR